MHVQNAGGAATGGLRREKVRQMVGQKGEYGLFPLYSARLSRRALFGGACRRVFLYGNVGGVHISAAFPRVRRRLLPCGQEGAQSAARLYRARAEGVRARMRLRVRCGGAAHVGRECRLVLCGSRNSLSSAVSAARGAPDLAAASSAPRQRDRRALFRGKKTENTLRRRAKNCARQSA